MLLCACSGEKKQSEKFGGYLRTNEFQKHKTLFPLQIDEINNYHIACQIYEGLVRFDNELNILPALAKSWEINADRNQYAFHLRHNVLFHKNSCFGKDSTRQVNANDILFCFERLCTNTPENRQYAVTFKDHVLGAGAYYAGEAKKLSGVEVINDSTVQITLTHPDPNFLSVLAMAGCFIYPKEAWQKYGNDMATKAVGTGPFTLQRSATDKSLSLVKNQFYWGTDEEGNSLPYLDSVCWSFQSDRMAELEMFKNNQLDMMYRVPAANIKPLFDAQANDSSRFDFEVYSAPALSVHFYGFNLQKKSPFQNSLVRKAINMAIDRQAIIDEVFQGEGTAANAGVVPYNLAFDKAGFPYKEIKGFEYNPDSAKKLLQKAGYGDKKKLPELTLDINDGNGGKNLLTAIKVEKMLKKNLDINVNMNIVQWAEHIDQVQNGKSNFYRYAWVADYADPESFLTMFYGKHVPSDTITRSYVNLSRFSNKMFDTFFEDAQKASDEKIRMHLLGKAAQVLIDEAAFVPLYYDENIRVVKKRVHNLQENAMNYIDFRNVWISK